MNTVYIVNKDNNESWRSCKRIHKNILACFQNIPSSQLKHIHTSVPMKNNFFSEDAIIFCTDYRVETINYIQQIPCNVPVVIYLYGDFTLHINNWISIENLLHGRKVLFVTASHSQKSLVKKFIPKENLLVSPFLVNEKEFYFCQKKRSDFRKEYKIKENELVFVYTGRLSHQKNIIQLIKNFNAIQKIIPHKIKLFIAGQIDHLGIPYKGINLFKGYIEFELNKVLTDDTIFLGSLQTAELNSLLCGSDHFISLSTHNDEDFGMSPAEALMTGLPSTLTAWGGYNSFQKYIKDKSRLTYVKVQLDNSGPQINNFEIQKCMFKAKTITNMERISLSKQIQSHLAIEANIYTQNNMKELVSQILPFKGFLKEARRFASIMNRNEKFLQGKSSFSDEYIKYYEAYLT